MTAQPSPVLVGFQVAVNSGHRVAVLDLLNHPCAGHILDDAGRADASAGIAELVARMPGAELVSGVTGGGQSRLSGVADDSPGVLQFHERAVLELVTAGYANREIADRLRLSPNSVKSYIRTAYRKIDVTSRAEAVRWGRHHGAGC